MDIKKTIRNYTKIYRKALIKAKISDIDVEIAAYEKKLEEMYNSDNAECISDCAEMEHIRP